MWCFIDESWAERPTGGRVGVMLAIACGGSAIQQVERMVYAVRMKYFGLAHAKNAERELKGSLLLSKNSFKWVAKNPGRVSRNHCVAREVLSWCTLNCRRLPLAAFASTVVGADPRLECLDPRALELPFRELLLKVSTYCRERYPRDRVFLVFDQREAAQKGLAIGIHNFVAGVGLANIAPYPYFAVSNIAPVIQVADICAYITARRAVGDRRFLQPWWEEVKRLQWSGRVEGAMAHGFARYDQTGSNQFRVRPTW